ncbi:T9SS type A sorting domain-containing protein [Winogradskyella schleiferi]|uniref:T9SS type A sorting domain-containing protein n=1 Tax=Winogradskyella schleiferi TaxID=2686078 RepID=UPI0015BC8DCF|nr:T9SS type A sorting domain-containing protein [Winogradskyella schleiferi]
MKKFHFPLIVFLLLFSFSHSNAQNSCADATSLCGSFGVVFPNTSGDIFAETGPDYNCLGSQPNPTWFYIPIATTGDVNFQISQFTNMDGSGQQLDVDFIVWGPFDNTTCDPLYLSLDNVVDCSFSVSAVETVEMPNVQPGEVYMLMVTNYSSMAGFIEMTETTNTNFFDTVDCTGFTLNAFIDTNGNDIKDDDEVDFPYGSINYTVNDGEEVILENNTGNYYIFENDINNSYDFEYIIDSSFSSYYAAGSAIIDDQYVISGEITNYDIPIDVLSPYNDLSISITPLNSPNPGFDTDQRITFKNLGTSQILAGVITYTFDANTTFVSSSDVNTTQTANTLTISFADLASFETRTVDITLNTHTPPDVNINDILTFSANISSDGISDINSADNDFVLETVVVGSFDPNDKLEAHAGSIVYDDFTTDNYLYYTIRFQNTGTASAKDVVIKDFLTDELDASTLVMLSSSHSYQLKKMDQDLEWEFRNINLVDSTNDEPNSHGFLQFKIKPTAGYNINTVFENTAEIYFDFNEPIITNTSVTSFSETLSIDNIDSDLFSIYPNPTNGTIYIASESILQEIKITNMLGQTLILKTLNTNTTSIDLEPFSKGSYFISIQSGEREITKRIIKN